MVYSQVFVLPKNQKRKEKNESLKLLKWKKKRFLVSWSEYQRDLAWYFQEKVFLVIKLRFS